MWPSSSVSAIYFILVAHLYAVLLITYWGNIGQVFRCAGADSYLIFFLFQLNLLLLLSFFIVIPAHPLPLEYTHYIILQILCQFSKTLYSSYDSFAYTATDGKKYNVDYYNLDVIISVGYRVKSHRGTQFRIWAMGIIKEYMKKGFALDDDRLKRLGGGNYFAELLARIRDIRSAEKSILEKGSWNLYYQHWL